VQALSQLERSFERRGRVEGTYQRAFELGVGRGALESQLERGDRALRGAAFRTFGDVPEQERAVVGPEREGAFQQIERVPVVAALEVQPN